MTEHERLPGDKLVYIKREDGQEEVVEQKSLFTIPKPEEVVTPAPQEEEEDTQEVKVEEEQEEPEDKKEYVPARRSSQGWTSAAHSAAKYDD